MPVERDIPGSCCNTRDAKHPDTAPWPRGSLAATRRKTSVKEPRVGDIATLGHSPTVRDLRDLQKALVAEHVITPTLPESGKKPCKSDVERQRNMKRPKK